ncbi:nitrilase-related carbon-nitrogen hydrolase [Aquibium sp. ELW1220]|uniref:nitrilase-related carbon-nitrogen hydrolase n=1 Tax=Aquibium sp. ELW1220 TaxID=2976766 RepID=UPI0025AEF7F7|nr:nitrilase-related carbon-nitrogen hydrolase [Aquibium sp. ELW1220]MDN2583770.1 hypothetical protein [Aquibium sp. ELW1220]
MEIVVTSTICWCAALAGIAGCACRSESGLLRRPVVVVSDVRVATLVYYEQLLIWPMLQSALSTPGILVAPSNGWWTYGTNIAAIQIAASSAWARLFHLPLVLVSNR